MRKRCNSSASESAPPSKILKLPSSDSPRSRDEPSNPASPIHGSTEQDRVTKVKHADHSKAKLDSKLDHPEFDASLHEQAQNAFFLQRSLEDPSVPASPIHGSTEQKWDKKEKIQKLYDPSSKFPTIDLTISLDSSEDVDCTNMNSSERYVCCFVLYNPINSYPTILIRIYCRASPKCKCHTAYGPADSTDDEYSESGSEDSEFLIQPSDKIAITGPKRRGMSLRSSRSNSSELTNPKESYQKLVFNCNDCDLPTSFLPPIHTVDVPNDLPGTTDRNEPASAASLFRDTAPVKGNQNLEITSTAVPNPKKKNPFPPITIESISKKNYLQSKGISDDPKLNWEKSFSHHSCYMVPSDFCKLITKFIIPSLC